MTMRTSLLSGAALGALIVLAVAPTANAAKARHHHHRAPPPPPADAGPTLKDDVDELRGEVADLRAWKDQEMAADAQRDQRDQQLQSQLADANARASRAEAQVQAQIETIPGEVKTEVAKAQPKPGWWANTSVSGRMYYDLTNINERDSAGNAGLNLGTASFPPSGDLGHNPSGINFDIKRFYVSVDHTFNDVYSADITTDFLYDFTSKTTELYIKKAYLQVKLDGDVAKLQIGSADQPWVPFVEDFYGYRYVENVLIDRTKFGTSADWGVHLLGAVPTSSGVNLGYSLSVTNGMGYKVPGFVGGVNRSNAMDFEGRVSVGYKGFLAAIGGYDGKLGQDYSGTITFHDAERFDALVGYSDKWFKIGGEYMWASSYGTASQITNPAKPDTSNSYSVFGNINLTKQIALFGRYDWVKPKSVTAATQLNTYYDVGVSWEPVKIVDFALVYKHDQIDNGSFADSNFATLGPNVHGYYDEFGVWGQFRW